MNSIENLVFAEVNDRFNELNGMKANSEEGKATANMTIQLVELAVKLAEAENHAKANELKEKELEESRKKRVWDFAKEIAKVVIPAGIGLGGAVLLTNYERTDTVVSTAPKKFWDLVFRIK